MAITKKAKINHAISNFLIWQERNPRPGILLPGNDGIQSQSLPIFHGFFWHNLCISLAGPIGRQPAIAGGRQE
ncbi:MAG: hypothetical protein ABL951_16050 [Alphaproteobacteria bacterium]